jgi:hypothetical protein
VRTHASFLVYGYVGDWTWVTYDLAKPGVDTKLLGRRNSRLLLSVRNASALLKNPDTSASQDEAPTLRSKFEGRTESLCAIYMGSGNCPSL